MLSSGKNEKCVKFSGKLKVARYAKLIRKNIEKKFVNVYNIIQIKILEQVQNSGQIENV